MIFKSKYNFVILELKTVINNVWNTSLQKHISLSNNMKLESWKKSI